MNFFVYRYGLVHHAGNDEAVRTDGYARSGVIDGHPVERDRARAREARGPWGPVPVRAEPSLPERVRADLTPLAILRAARTIRGNATVQP